MSWVSFFWAGLLAVAVPYWIHRLRIRGRTRIPISSISIIRTGRERARRRWKRDRSRLLWLRITALLFFALALATTIPPLETPEYRPPPSKRSGFQSSAVSAGSQQSNPLPVALSIEEEAVTPLRTALEMISDSLALDSTVVRAEDPVVWSRQQALDGRDGVQGIFLLQGWPSDPSRTDRWFDWIRAGGHLVVEVQRDEHLIAVNRWISGAGLDRQSKPARAGDQLSPIELAQWLGDRLYGRPVDDPRIHLPDRPPVVVWSEGESGRVLLRTRFGDPLVWRVAIGEGWLTMSGFSWRGDRSSWLYHPLFPFVLDGLLRIPAPPVTTERGNAIESPGDSLTNRIRVQHDRPSETVSTGSAGDPGEWVWLGCLALAMALFLMESLAGRYLSSGTSRTPPK